MDYKFHSGVIRWQILKSIKAISPIFALALTVEILTSEIFDPEKVRQGHGLWQFCYSIAVQFPKSVNDKLHFIGARSHR